MNTTLTLDNALFGHTDEASALVVDDYPYGYRVRTSIRYWLETTKSGDRFVSQTLNPKTGRWNKPKKSTYVEVGVMYRNDESGHIEWTGLSLHADDDFLEHFQNVTDGNLTPIQVKKVATVIGYKRAMAKVTFTIREGTQTPEQEAEQADNEVQLRRWIGYNIAVAQKEVTTAPETVVANLTAIRDDLDQ